jgi:DNA modification methylase
MLFLEGNVIDCLRSLPEQSVHCVITSPPYMGLRDYGLPPTKWPVMDYHPLPGFTQHLDEETACLGLEKTPESYIGHLVLVFRELWRVLRDDGTVFLNLGDSFAGGGPHHGDKNLGKSGTNRGCVGASDKVDIPGLKPKDLIGIPWRVAFALQTDGWYLRSDMVWAKGVSGQGSIWRNVYNACLENKIPEEVSKRIADSIDPYVGNPMPESVKDRPTRAHEYIFLLTKSRKYFYDHVAVQEDCANGDPTSPRGSNGVLGSLNSDCRFGGNKYPGVEGKNTYSGNVYKPLAKRNMRDVIVLPTQPFKGSHFAVFPEALVEPCIKAGTSEKGCCPKCGAPWVRVVEKSLANTEGWGVATKDHTGATQGSNAVIRNAQGRAGDSVSTTLGWHPTCSCGLDPIPCVVLDPFGGSGTVAKVSRDLGRDSVYCDLNPDYVRMAMDRVGSSLFNNVDHRKVTTTLCSKE